MQQMFELAEREGINVRWWNFEPPIRGMYWAPQKAPPIIFLSNSLEGNTRLLRCVMAEELGHHFTLEHECLCDTYYNYRDRLAVSRAEFRALRWAAQYLIPIDKFAQAVRNGVTEQWQLAETFDVIEDIVVYRLAMPDAVKVLYGPVDNLHNAPAKTYS